MEDGTGIAPAWSPPVAATPRSHRRAALAIAIVVVTVSAAAMVTARSVALPVEPLPQAAVFMPPDGEVSVYELANAGGDTVLVQEHQRIVGFNAITSLPDGMGVQVLSQYPDDELSARVFWRVTARQLRDDMVGPQTMEVLTVDDKGIQRLASFGGAFPSVYDPPLVIVPNDAAVGDTWDATGSALLDGALAYTYSASVEEVSADGCVLVASQLDLEFDGDPFISLGAEERWCPGSGLVRADLVFDEGAGPEMIDYALADDPQSLLAGEDGPVPPPLGDAGDPAGWELVPLTPTHREPFFGDMLIDGITALPPVAGSGGLVVIAFTNGRDVLGLRVGEPADDAEPGSVPLVEEWRAHPGGDPLAMAVLGDLVVVSTSQRRLAAYDLNGVRRWLVETDDLVMQPAVRVGGEAGDAADIVVVHDLSGAVTAVDARDGTVRWRDGTRTESDLTPVALGDTVVVADRSGDLFAVDAATGRRRWVSEQDGVGAIGSSAGLLLAARSDGTVVALDERGRERWTTDAAAWQGRIDDVAGQPALIGSDEVIVLDPSTGAIRWSIPVTEWADGWSGGVAVHDRSRVCAYDADGAEIACWPYVGDLSAVRMYVLATDEGLWTLDESMEVARIAPAFGGFTP